MNETNAIYRIADTLFKRFCIWHIWLLSSGIRCCWEEACRQQEREAQASLSRKQMPPRVEKYCREVGKAVGGSYQIMNACVEQELAAKARLR